MIYVAEIHDNSIQSINLFPNDRPGKEEAKHYFKILCEENGIGKNVSILEDGTAEAECGDWNIQIGICS